jgi:oxygen-independent coproporphyrinogen-3 oxidase
MGSTGSIAGLGAPVDEERVRGIERHLDEHRHRRQGNKVLHGYPPPLLWRERRVPVEEVLARGRRTAPRVPKRLLLYVGTPYCLPTEPDRCGFCLFPSEVYRRRSQLDEYLGALERESRLYRCAGDGARLEGLYLGGGTANLYLPDQYPRLLGIVRSALGSIPPTAEVTLEGIPQLFTREKLAAAKAAGVNRISLGVQQLDDEMIRASGRRQRSEQVFRTLEDCAELGLPASVDLIFGWPRQTVERMLRDLEAVTAAGVGHITHYELNVAGRTPFALERRGELPSREENLALYRAAKTFLEGAGYRQRTAYDWERIGGEVPAGYRFESAWHRPLGSPAEGEISGVDLWGWGFAGVSTFLGTPGEPGWSWIHHTRVEAYFKSLEEGRLPVERGVRLGPRAQRLNVLFARLHALEVDLAEYRRLFGLDLLAEYGEVWCALLRRGWIEVESGRLRLVGDGVFHTPLIQSVLARGAVQGGR